MELCILCGCDYSSRIRGVGEETALRLIRAHGNIEDALRSHVGSKERSRKRPREGESGENSPGLVALRDDIESRDFGAVRDLLLSPDVQRTQGYCPLPSRYTSSPECMFAMG